MNANLILPQIHEYIQLRVLLNNIHLHEEIEDVIVWNLTASSEYSTTSAYPVQFFGATTTNMNKLAWKGWTAPKLKLFA
jgi:hypothetical protein